MNILFNEKESRFRAGPRLLIFIVLGIIFTTPTVLLEVDWLLFPALALGFFVATYITTQTLDQRPLKGIGLGSDTLWWKEFIIGSVLAAGVQSLIFITQYSLGWLEITGFGWERVGNTHWMISVIIFFIQMLCVGFYEELVFRGYAVRNLTEGFTTKRISPQQSAWIAIFGTSVLFGIAHAGNPNASFVSTFNIIIAGLMLGVPFILTGRLALSIGIHFSWNFVMGGVYGMAVSGLDNRRSVIQTAETGPDVWTGGSFGPEAGIIGLIAIVLLTGAIILYVKKLKGTVELDEGFQSTYISSAENKEG